MSGLDNIVKRIKAEAREQVDIVEKEVSSFKKEYVGQVKAETSAEIKKIVDQSARDRAIYEEKVVSNGEFRRRNAVLKAKGEMIDETIQKALDELKALDDNAYFETILNIVKENAQAKEGQIRFCAKDIARLPDGFEAKVSEVAQSKGGKLTIDSTNADIDYGFILVYGDIEENCTFDAIVASKRDQLRDIVNKNLFE